MALLDGVEELRVLFLENTDGVDTVGSSSELDSRNWPESWVIDTSQPGSVLNPPLAVELILRLSDWGEMRRIYALPPL